MIFKPSTLSSVLRSLCRPNFHRSLCLPGVARAGFTMSSYLSGAPRDEFFADPELQFDPTKHLARFLSDFHGLNENVTYALDAWKPGDHLATLLGEIDMDYSLEAPRIKDRELVLKDVVERLEAIAPLKYAEPWDNVGLLIEPHNTTKPINHIMLTIDLTDEVLKEAVENGTDLIVSYHPPVFSPVKRVNNNEWKQRVISTCLAHNIAVFSPHTSWDSIQGGVNDWLASIYDIKDYLPLQPTKPDGFGQIIMVGHKANESDVVPHLTGLAEKANIKHAVSIHNITATSTHVLVTDAELGAFLSCLYTDARKYDSVTVAKRPLSISQTTGSGRFVNLNEPIPLLRAIKKMKAHLNKLVLRVAIPQGRKENEIMIHSVAVCAGSGGSLLKGTQADLWITGEMSHHDILDATHRGITVLLLEHSDSERGYLKSFQQILRYKLLNYLNPMQVWISKADRDPIGYV